MANEQKVNAAKGKKINFYKFVGKIENKRGVFTSIGDGKVVEALNNLGSTANGIARVLDEYVKLSAKNFLDQQKNKNRFAKRQEATPKKGGKERSSVLSSFGKVAAAGVGGILGLFGSLFQLFVVLPILDWLRKPENQKKLQNIVAGLGEAAKFLYKLISGVVFTTLELIAGFTKLPFWKEILKLGLFFAALGASLIAFRKLFGKTAAKTVVKTVFKIFKTFFSQLTKFSVALAKRVKRGFARGALRGGKGRLAAGLIASVGTSILIDRVVDSQTGKELDDAEREVTDEETKSEVEQKKKTQEFERQMQAAIKATESNLETKAKDKATPSPVGGPQPAPNAKPTPVGKPITPQAAPVAPTGGVGGILPDSVPVAPELPPPQMSRGGRLRKLAEGGRSGATKFKGLPPKYPATGGPNGMPMGGPLGGFQKPKFKPLSDLGKFIGRPKASLGDIGGEDFKKQQSLLPKLVQLPLKAVGLATLGILTNLAKVLGVIPGAGMLANVLKAMIGPVASAFGLKSNVVQMTNKGIPNRKRGEEEKKKADLQQAKTEAKAAAVSEQTTASQGAGVTDSSGRNLVGPKIVGAKRVGPGKVGPGGVFGALGRLFGRSEGGWISGPQTGYPVSLDRGKSVSFIGHGTEYVATRSGGGGDRSAYVIPFDTPATRGNKNLTGRRMGEAISAGYKFADGGATPTTPMVDPGSATVTSALKLGTESPEPAMAADPSRAGSAATAPAAAAPVKAGTKPVSIGKPLPGGDAALTPMQQWARNFPDLAKKVKPGQSGYEEIRAYLDGKTTNTAYALAAKGVTLGKPLVETPITKDIGKKAFAADSKKMSSIAAFAFGLPPEIMEKRDELPKIRGTSQWKGDTGPGSRFSLVATDKDLTEVMGKLKSHGVKGYADGGKISAAAKSMIGKKYWPNGCADSTRDMLAKAGVKPNPEVTKKILDPGTPGSLPTGKRMANSFGSDQGSVIKNSGNVQPGDVVMWDYGGGVIGHVGVAIDGGRAVHNSSSAGYKLASMPITAMKFHSAVRLGATSAADPNSVSGAAPGANGAAPGANGAAPGGPPPDPTADFSSALKTAIDSLKSAGFAAGGAVTPMITKGANIGKDLQNMLKIKDYQAAGIVGNLIQESSLVPDRKQGTGMQRGPLKLDGRTGYSLPQWTSIDRQQKFAKYMESKGFDWKNKGATLPLAIGFLAQEFKTYMSNVFTNTKDVGAASNWVLKNYEKPADQGPREQKERAHDSAKVLSAMGGVSGFGTALDPNAPASADSPGGPAAPGSGQEAPADPFAAFKEALDTAIKSLGGETSATAGGPAPPATASPGVSPAGGVQPAKPGTPTPAGGVQPANTNYEQMSIDQLRKMLRTDLTPTDAEFAAAKKAREEGKAAGLSGEQLEQKVLAATVRAKYGGTPPPAPPTPANVKPATPPSTSTVLQSSTDNKALKANAASTAAETAAGTAVTAAASIANQSQGTINTIAGGGGVVSVAAGGSKQQISDIQKYRPGFGLFAGIGYSGMA